MIILIELAKILAALILCIIPFAIFFITGVTVLLVIVKVINGLINEDE